MITSTSGPLFESIGALESPSLHPEPASNETDCRITTLSFLSTSNPESSDVVVGISGAGVTCDTCSSRGVPPLAHFPATNAEIPIRTTTNPKMMKSLLFCMIYSNFVAVDRCPDPHDHSYLNASLGSRRAARIAGYSPITSPINTAPPNASGILPGYNNATP